MVNFMENRNKITNRREDTLILSSILTNLDAIAVGFTKLTVAQHLSGIMRSKGNSVYSKPYNWTNKELLSKIENYRLELENSPPDVWGTDYDND